MFVSTFIARRYFAGRKKMFASFLSVVAVFGVALGVFALIVVMSVMMGFGRDLQQKLIGFNAHIVVEGIIPPVMLSEIACHSRESGNPVNLNVLDPCFHRDDIRDKPIFEQPRDIESSAEIIDGEGIVEVPGSNGESAQGVKIRGMDKEDLGKLKGVEFFYSAIWPSDNRAIALVGSELAFQLGVHPDYGDKITLTVPIGRVGPMGELIPERMTFDVGGMFKSGYFEHDSKTIIISKEAVQKLLGGRAEPSLHIWLKDFRKSGEVVKKIREAFPDLKVFTWTEANKKLFAALTLERIAMSILLLLIIVIASISIVSVIFMYVFVRRKDIAILSSIGASPKDIRNIFIKIGAYIGLGGTLIGLVFGIFTCLYLEGHNIPLPSSYYLDHLPVVISRPFLAVVAICGVLLAILAAIYPSNQAVKLKPQELLRYE